MTLKWTERLVCMFGICFLCSALLPHASADADGFNPKLYLLNALFYGAVALLSLIYWRRMESFLVRSRNLLLLILLAVASSAWSSSPEVTLKRAALLCGTSLFGVYLGSRFTTQEQIDLVGNTLLILAVLSIVVALGRPTYGLDDEAHIGAWRGVFAHKNTLGRGMVLGACAFFCSASDSQFGKLRRVLGISVCLALIVLSRSRDAAILAMLLFAVSTLTLKFRSRVFIVGAIATVSAAVASFVIYPEACASVLEALGRDATLTGRTEIWRSCVESIARHPWLGYGVGGFWRGFEGPSIAVIAAAGWNVPHAHNGYIDLMLDLGVVGLVAFTCGYVSLSLHSIRRFRDQPDRQHWWPVLYLSFLFLSNLGESSILGPNSIFWALYVACAAAQIKERFEIKVDRKRAIWKLRTREEPRNELPHWIAVASE